jgi:shikimate kinase
VKINKIEDSNMAENEEVIETSEEETEGAELSNVEQEARKMGWRPPEEAINDGLDPKDAIGAQEYINRGPLMKQIKNQKRQIVTIAQKFDQLLQKFNQAELQGHQRALQELTAQRNAAYDESDLSRVQQAERDMQSHQAQIQTLTERKLQDDEQSQATAHPEAHAFMTRNAEWWGKDQSAMQFAAATELRLILQNPELNDTDELYDMVQEEVNNFRNKGKGAPTTKGSYVTPPQRGGVNKSAGEPGYHDLKRDFQDLYDGFKLLYKNTYNQNYTIKQFIDDQLNDPEIEVKDLLKN